MSVSVIMATYNGAEYIEEQLANCRCLNAEKAEFSFEKEEWKISIIVKRKKDL